MLYQFARGVLAAGLVIGLISNAFAARTYLYPSRSQSPEQQVSDTNACQSWATAQTGYRMTVQPVTQEQTGGEVAKGSFVGLLFAPLAATPAAPVVVGGLLGGTVRLGKKSRNAARREVAASTAAAHELEYQRAFNACMAGRNYTVR